MCSLNYDNFPEIRFKIAIYNLAYNITLYSNILNCSIMIRMVSPVSCQYTAYVAI